ncbi:MAG: glucokinase, partial [Pseudomonadota bacterium]
MRTAFPALIGDIGGTNARFEWLATADTAPQPLAIVKTEAFDGPEAAIAWALRSADLPAPQSALLAAAGPIREDGLDLTNCDWAIRPQHFLQTTGISRLQLFNDFEAQ